MNSQDKPNGHKISGKTDSSLLFRLSKHAFYNIGALILAGALMFTSCDNSIQAEESVTIGEITGLEVTPDNHTLKAGESIKFTTFALTASGDKIPLSELPPDWEWLWLTSDTEIATFSNNTGNLTGHKAGSTICWIFLAGPDGAASTKSIAGSSVLNSLLKSLPDPDFPKIQVIPILWDSFGVTILAPSPLAGENPISVLPGK